MFAFFPKLEKGTSTISERRNPIAFHSAGEYQRLPHRSRIQGLLQPNLSNQKEYWITDSEHTEMHEEDSLPRD